MGKSEGKRGRQGLDALPPEGARALPTLTWAQHPRIPHTSKHCRAGRPARGQEVTSKATSNREAPSTLSGAAREPMLTRLGKDEQGKRADHSVIAAATSCTGARGNHQGHARARTKSTPADSQYAVP